MNKDNCPCCSGRQYHECCQPIIEGKQVAISAEALMRSRYSAYCLQDSKYLLSSWHSASRPGNIDFADAPDWQGLQIVRTELGQAEDDTGKVEFIARFTRHGNQASLHETSRFTKEQGHWVYVDGQIHAANPAQNPNQDQDQRAEQSPGQNPEQNPEQTKTASTPATGKISRNAPCPCGSGKKYKRCCLI